MTALARRLLVLALLAIVVVLPFAAYADPLDPTWAGGYWDDDDFDYVILLVTNLEASLPPEVPHVHHTTEAVGVVRFLYVAAPVIDRPLPFRRRGPPSA